MVQEFHVLRCYSCQTFQVQQVKKSKKWNCKMCGEKQSLIKEFGRGTGADCRRHVQKLNARRGEVVEEQTQKALSRWEEVQGEAAEEQGGAAPRWESQNVGGSQVSRWTKYLGGLRPGEEEEEEEENIYMDRSHLHGNRNVRKRKRGSGDGGSGCQRGGEGENSVTATDGWAIGGRPARPPPHSRPGRSFSPTERCPPASDPSRPAPASWRPQATATASCRPPSARAPGYNPPPAAPASDSTRPPAVATTSSTSKPSLTTASVLNTASITHPSRTTITHPSRTTITQPSRTSSCTVTQTSKWAQFLTTHSPEEEEEEEEESSWGVSGKSREEEEDEEKGEYQYHHETMASFSSSAPGSRRGPRDQDVRASVGQPGCASASSLAGLGGGKSTLSHCGFGTTTNRGEGPARLLPHLESNSPVCHQPPPTKRPCPAPSLESLFYTEEDFDDMF